MKFQLIHRETGLTLRQHRSKYPLIYYQWDGKLKADNDLENSKLKCLIREDGAIAVQRLKPGYGEGEIYFLNRDEWEIQIR